MYLLTIHLLQTQTRGWGHQVVGTGRSTNEHTNEQGQTGMSKQAGTNVNEWGRARTSGGQVRMSSNEQERAQRTMNMQGQARTSGDKRKRVRTSTNEGQEGW